MQRDLQTASICLEGDAETFASPSKSRNLILPPMHAGCTHYKYYIDRASRLIGSAMSVSLVASFDFGFGNLKRAQMQEPKLRII